MAIAAAAHTTDTELLRQRHLADARRALPEHFERIAWPGARIRAERQTRLQALIAVAKARSPWHRRRLAHIDPETVTEDDLGRIPPMTKDDLMAHFDEIVTDPRLALGLVESHLAAIDGEAYLFDRYHAVASSGSSGRRGVFVHDWDAWTTYYLACFRFLLRERLRTDCRDRRPARMAAVAAGRPTHMSAATFRTFSDPARLELHRFPVTLPLEEIVAGLDEVQPDILSGYPSALHQLALEARAGALTVAPQQIVVYAEPLLTEHRHTLEEVWGAPVHNWWGTSEANVIAAACGRGPGLHLHDDLYLVEPIALGGAPVRVGERSAAVLLTNLRNHALPLIRYEITDEITLLDGGCPCGSALRRIADVEGRLEEAFHYPEVPLVHPHVFRTRLAAEPAIVDYQVAQTCDGVEVRAQCAGQLDLERVRSSLVEGLRRCGLSSPQVSVVPVPALDRGSTGKLMRFVALDPLAGRSASTRDAASAVRQ